MQAFDELRSKQIPKNVFWLVITFCKINTCVCFLTMNR